MKGGILNTGVQGLMQRTRRHVRGVIWPGSMLTLLDVLLLEPLNFSYGTPNLYWWNLHHLLVEFFFPDHMSFFLVKSHFPWKHLICVASVPTFLSFFSPALRSPPSALRRLMFISARWWCLVPPCRLRPDSSARSSCRHPGMGWLSPVTFSQINIIGITGSHFYVNDTG